MTENKTALSLPIEAADRLIAAHDGDVALLYLYIARTGAWDAERAAEALCRTSREIDAAAEKLRRMGLLDAAPAPVSPPLQPADELPEYRAEDLLRFAAEDPQLEAIYREAEQIFGRKLSPADMKMLAGVYKHLGLPAEVLLLLAYVSWKKGLMEEARDALREAARLTNLFDSAPEYSLKSMRFIEHAEYTNAFDTLGPTAAESIEYILNLLDDPFFTQQWKEILNLEQ